VTGTSQSNIASKSTLQGGVGDGVGEGQGPTLKKSSQRSGQTDKQGDLPNNKQVGSPNEVAKHHLVCPVE